MRKFNPPLFICILLFLLSIFSTDVFGFQDQVAPRHVTLVNPVRGRNYWIDKTIDPFLDQYSLIVDRGFSATWLLQYEVLNDNELLDEIKQVGSSQELGLFLEVSEVFAEESRIVYPPFKPWFDPGAVFLSGYTQSERRKLIDNLFKKFESEFGFYPKSVGAWWIDSYSLNYMINKYDIEAVLIVADQKTTDNYGISGQWWGIPYYPSKANTLTPASSLQNKQDIVVTQWAQRDLTRAYGKGLEFSNYSLQANDYTERGKNTSYFASLVDIYLNGDEISQITVGLETGMEGVKSYDEYVNQLEHLKSLSNVEFVTMSKFSSLYKKAHPRLPEEQNLSDNISNWTLTRDHRENEVLKDRVNYSPDISFFDYYLPDKSGFLDRLLPEKSNQVNKRYIPWFFLVVLGGLVVFVKQRRVYVWIASMLFSFAAYGLVLRSFIDNGWLVYYGPTVTFLEVLQAVLVLISMLFFYFLHKLKKDKLLLLLLPLAFGINVVIGAARYSYIEGKHYLGVALDALRFVGIRFSALNNLEVINQDMPAYQAIALLRFDFARIWNNLFLSIVVYPVIYILIAVILFMLLKRLPKKLVLVTLLLLIVLYTAYVVVIFGADPRVVVPIFN